MKKLSYFSKKKQLNFGIKLHSNNRNLIINAYAFWEKGKNFAFCTLAKMMTKWTTSKSSTMKLINDIIIFYSDQPKIASDVNRLICKYLIL